MAFQVVVWSAFLLGLFGCVWLIFKRPSGEPERTKSKVTKLKSAASAEIKNSAKVHGPVSEIKLMLDEEANRLVDDKPKGWEYLLFAHQIRAGVVNINRITTFPAYGAGSSVGKKFNSNRECMVFCRDKLVEVDAIIKAIKDSGFDGDIVNAVKSGKVELLLQAANKVTSGFKSLVDWESGVKSEHVAYEHQRAVMLLSEMAEPAINKLDDFCHSLYRKVSEHIDRVARGENPGYIEFECVLELGDGTRLTEECDRLAGEVGQPGSAADISKFGDSKGKDEIGDLSDSGYSGDVYNYWIPLEDYSRKVIAHLHVKYMKNRGEIVERDFDLQSFKRGPEGYQLHGFCHKRGRARTLVSMGFIECFDRETGEVIPDIEAYVERIYASTPTGKFDAIYDEHGAEVNILVYLAKADGAMRSNERTLIADYILAKLGESAPNSATIHSELKNQYSMTLSEFRATVTGLAARNPESLREIIEIWDGLASNKKNVHTDETRALNYMRRTLKNQRKPA